jgi:propanol-preferring alcohol dehydrogenase
MHDHETMRAMMFSGVGKPLTLHELPIPTPLPEQVLIRVKACAVCRTDLHIIDGDLPTPLPGVILGHEVTGTIESTGAAVTGYSKGDRVGVPWLGHTCGRCVYCLSGRENLCRDAKFTGYTLDGGFADYMVADHQYCFSLPDAYTDQAAAPLMCAGLIGYRALSMAGDAARSIGIYGFGAAAHIITQVARHQGRKVFAFTRPDDIKGQQFARELGAVWAGSSLELPPEELDAALIFAPIGSLVPLALKALGRGGTVVCSGIHMTDIPSFPYKILWQERSLKSVANLTRRDGLAFLALAPNVPVKTVTHLYPLEQVNQALNDLRHGRFEGAAVISTDL